MLTCGLVRMNWLLAMVFSILTGCKAIGVTHPVARRGAPEPAQGAATLPRGSAGGGEGSDSRIGAGKNARGSHHGGQLQTEREHEQHGSYQRATARSNFPSARSRGARRPAADCATPTGSYP